MNVKFKVYDLDSNGEVTQEEIAKTILMKKGMAKYKLLRDQSRMAWFSLFCMGVYPILILVSSLLGFDQASVLLSDITGVYFGSIAVVVAAFMGSEAYATRKDPDDM